MYAFLDIHTHAFPMPENSGDHIFHAFHQQEREQFAGYTQGCSVGLHPWFLAPDDMESQWHWLEEALRLPNVRMVGEAGLDTLRGPSLGFQQFCFEKQLRCASAQSKPVVIHCVRAFEALKTCIRAAAPDIPLILHGFNRSEKMLPMLRDTGFYFSFGAALCREGHPATNALKAIPRDRLFLETDDSGVSIHTIYQKAAKILALPLDELRGQIWENSIKIGIV
jgi:TatD DNase family protein